MTRRVIAFARATLCLAVLGAAIAGPPLLLVRTVGSPFPTQVPTLETVVDAVRYAGVGPNTVVKALAVVVWIAWAQILWVALVEARAAVGGRIAPSVRALPGLQPSIARLIAVIAVSVASLASTRPAIALPRPPLASIVSSPPSGLTIRRPPVAAPFTVAQTTSRAQWTVARHDTYWDIAERVLGDGHAWRRIRDENVGRTMPDGTVITATSDLLRPGWLLLLPADAATTPPSQDDTSAAVAVITAGDDLWSVAEREVTTELGRQPNITEVTTYWAELVDLNRHELKDPDVVRPGQTVRLPTFDLPAGTPPPDTAAATTTPTEPSPPPTPAPTTVPPTLPAPPPVAAPSSPMTAGDADPRAAVVDHQPARDRRPGVLGVAGGALAAGVALAYRRRRTRTLATRHRGHGLPAPQGFDDLRRELALTADLDGVARRDAAVADLVSAGADLGYVTVDDATIVAHLRHPIPRGPLGWTGDETGRTWRLDPEDPPLSGDAGSPTPLLLTVGRTEHGDALVDFESLRVTSILGDPDAVNDLLRSLLAEIAYAPPTRRAQVIAVGEIAALAHGDHIRTASHWPDIADDLMLLAEQTAGETSGQSRPLPQLRLDPAACADALVPTLVLLPESPDDARYRELAAAVMAGHTGIAIVIAGPAAPAQVITLEGEDLVAPSVDLHARRQAVTAEATDVIADLLAAADSAPGDGPPLDFGESDGDVAAIPDDLTTDVMIRVLGRVRVDGALRPLTPKQTAVVTYVALHAPVTADRIEDAVWAAATGSRRKRLANTLAECRGALGPNVLPVAEGGLYRLGSAASTDTHWFDHAVRQARATDPSTPEARAWLRQALELVDGPVFVTRSADRASYVWIDLENWIATWELKVADTALRLVDLATDAGDHDLAVWAAQHALHALPTHVELTEALMRAYANRGDFGAVERVYTSHVSALEAADLDDVAESTVDLWAQLRPRAPA